MGNVQRDDGEDGRDEKRDEVKCRENFGSFQNDLISPRPFR
jgi:hypothetical protein